MSPWPYVLKPTITFLVVSVCAWPMPSKLGANSSDDESTDKNSSYRQAKLEDRKITQKNSSAEPPSEDDEDDGYTDTSRSEESEQRKPAPRENNAKGEDESSSEGTSSDSSRTKRDRSTMPHSTKASSAPRTIEEKENAENINERTQKTNFLCALYCPRFTRGYDYCYYKCTEQWPMCHKFANNKCWYPYQTRCNLGWHVNESDYKENDIERARKRKRSPSTDTSQISDKAYMSLLATHFLRLRLYGAYKRSRLPSRREVEQAFHEVFKEAKNKQDRDDAMEAAEFIVKAINGD